MRLRERVLWPAQILLANAGSYTFPDRSTPFPYGLGGTEGEVTDANLAAHFGRPVLLLVGGQDTKRGKILDTSREADAQGEHRKARGKAYFKACEKEANKMGVEFNWEGPKLGGCAAAVPFMCLPFHHCAAVFCCSAALALTCIVAAACAVKHVGHDDVKMGNAALVAHFTPENFDSTDFGIDIGTGGSGDDSGRGGGGTRGTRAAGGGGGGGSRPGGGGGGGLFTMFGCCDANSAGEHPPAYVKAAAKAAAKAVL